MGSLHLLREVRIGLYLLKKISKNLYLLRKARVRTCTYCGR
jgi:hypothetical protein